MTPWTDGHLGFQWNTRQALVHSGDFNADGEGDLLIQAKPDVLLIDYDVQIPVPHYRPQSFGIVYSPLNSPITVFWNRRQAGVDWSAAHSNLVIADYNGDGRSDVIVQPRNASVGTYLVLTNSSTSQPNLSSPSALSFQSAGGGSADTHRMIAANFDGGATAGVYLQATSAAGIDYIAASIPSGGGVASTTVPSQQSQPAPASAVGRTVGAAAVSASGAAMYQIPLTLPPGVNGLTPSLSLNYNHNGGNGLLGMGWSIGGLSSIGRCNLTMAQDGAAAPVMLSANDGYCLDGNRLRLESGTYGAAGSVYRTEIETFSRITLNGASGSVPAHFVVEMRNGLKAEYGKTNDSHIEVVGSSTPRVWAVNRFKDRSDNVIDVAYTESSGSFRPVTVSWGSNTAQGTSHTHQVAFVYETASRPDTISGHLGGDETVSGQVVETNRLDRIDVLYNSSVIRRYDVAFEATGGAGGRSRLASIQECDRDLKCMPATTFGWRNGAAGVGGVVSTGQTVSPGYAMDINADGRDDFVYASGTTVYYMLANGSGGYGAATSSVSVNNFNAALMYEWDGDGRMDLLVPHSGGTWWIVRANGTGFDAPVDTTVPWNGFTSFYAAADADGDGRDDLVRADRPTGSAHSLMLRLRSGSTLGSEITAWTAGVLTELDSAQPLSRTRQNSRIRRVDFDRDGRGDLLVRLVKKGNPETGSPDQKYYGTFVAKGSASAPTFSNNGVTAYTTGALYEPLIGDFNNDGLLDLAYEASGGWRVRINRGRAMGTDFAAGIATSGYSAARILDWDGDGQEDLLLAKISPATWHVARSTGQALQTPVDTTIPVVNAGSQAVVDINGDGLYEMAEINSGASNALQFRLRNGPYPDLLSSVTDAFGTQVSFTYESISAGSACHSRDSSPLPALARTFTGPLQLVCSTTGRNGVGGTYTTQYQYHNANVHLQGRGFLGFARKTTHDSRDNMPLTETFAQEFPHIGMLTKSQLRQPNGTTDVRELTNTLSSHSYASGARALPFVSQSQLKDFEAGGAFDGQLIRTTTTTYLVDSSTGANYDTTTTVVEAATANGLNSGHSHTSRTYHSALFNDFTNWCFGRPQTTEQIQSHTMNGGTQKTRTSSRTWDGVKCRTDRAVTEPGDARWEVAEDYGYDVFGNVSSVLRTPAIGNGQSARTTSITWASPGHFPTSITNPKLQVTTQAWDYALGLQTGRTDPNGLTTGWQYDGFGRMRREEYPDGTATDLYLTWCNTPACQGTDANLRTLVTQVMRAMNGAEITRSYRYLDMLDRQTWASSRTLTGAYSTLRQIYNDRGLVHQTSTPYLNGDPVWYSTTTYDLLGRPTSIVRPTSESDSSPHSTSVSYEGLKVSVTDALSRTTNRRMNAIGQVIQAVDAAGGDIDYEYDAFGDVLKTKDVNNNEIVLTYNIRGMKMTSTDPDMGAWSYDYFPFGEMKSKTDAKAQTVTFTYDELSRLRTRNEAEGLTTFTYDTASNGVGQLATVSAPGGYAESYAYDNRARVQTHSTTIDGVSYSYTYGYHATQGMLQSLRYPASAGTPFEAQYDYQYGQLVRVKDLNAPSTVFWQANATNARHQIIDEQLGNGLRTDVTFDRISGFVDRIDSGFSGGSAEQQLQYTWDKVGNLTQRSDLNQGTLNETFTYDALGRLDIVRRNGVQTLDMQYDAIGNVENKTGVGSYTYHATKRHAAITAGANAYGYDANGNMNVRNGLPVTWYSYNLPEQINYTGGKYAKFWYGAARQRYKQEHHAGTTASVLRTTIYVGGLFEKVSEPSATTYFRHAIVANGTVVASLRRSESGGTITNVPTYFRRDHLGSVDAQYSGSSQTEVKYSFDAFGKRRGADWSGAPTTAQLDAAWVETSNRGYTGHEHLDNVGDLIHMNGRVYDSQIGRFISADPFITQPGNGQNYNRYAYVYNNPLRYLDPSGFSVGHTLLHCKDNCGGGGWSHRDGYCDRGPTWWSADAQSGGLAADRTYRWWVADA